MVPVLNKNKEPLMPCSEKRARLLVERGQANKYWQKGIFCIKLLKEPSDNKKQRVVLGIDPGSKREGYTVLTEKNVVLNITTNTPDWIKAHLENRKNNRTSRRQRKTPYRKCRRNRAVKAGWLPPSTKARWDVKLGMIRYLLSIIPITDLVVEEIFAVCKKGQKRWNVSFAPLQNGKNYFKNKLKKFNINYIFVNGYDTSVYRKIRKFKKLTGKQKMNFEWKSHCVDSHSLCEIFLNKKIIPFLGIWQAEYFRFHRRQLRLVNTKKGNKVQSYGGTISLGLTRGSVALYKNKLCYIGGNSNGMITVHSIINGQRKNQKVKINKVKILFISNKRVQFISEKNTWKHLKKLL